MHIDYFEKKLNISVSDLVYVACRRRECFKNFDYALKDDPSFVLSVRKREETQNGNSFFSEVNLTCSFNLCGFKTVVSGNTSIIDKNGFFEINLVKSIRYPLHMVNEDFAYDWICESKCLAFILSNKRNLDNVGINLSIYNTETLEKKELLFNFSAPELKTFFKNTLNDFSSFLKLNIEHVTKRNSDNNLKFPFANVRDGQKEIFKEIISGIKNKNNVIVNAPTGLGKTVATIYPALKAQIKGLCDKVFYLTAKDSGKQAVVDTVNGFINDGYDFKLLVISAKSKICNKKPCSPANCFMPSGHHQRIVSAVTDIAVNHKIITSDVILAFSEKYKVCPFLLELELIPFADVVLCDYNYIFDSTISSKIASCFSRNDVFLVDEAHNLVDRLRNVYSSVIELSKLKELKKHFEGNSEVLTAIKSFLSFINANVDNDAISEQFSSQMLDELERLLNDALGVLQRNIEGARTNKQLHDDDFNVLDSIRRFVDLLTLRSDDYAVFINDEMNLEIFLVNTANTILNLSKQLGTFVFFSGSLLPDDYYKFMLGNTRRDVYVSFDSPYDINNFLVLSYPLTTKYSERENGIEDVVRGIFTAGKSKKGNYIAFFPSYDYMNLAVGYFERMFPSERIKVQKSGMTEAERQEFLKEFSVRSDKSLYAFAVLGGSFSESIDLAGELLSGVIVVGLGALPPSRRNSLISQYFTDMFFDGEKFAYFYPGMNKVFQAGGRVIRSENDRGFILVVDDRFLVEDNFEIIPNGWKNIKRVRNNNDIKKELDAFWENA